MPDADSPVVSVTDYSEEMMRRIASAHYFKEPGVVNKEIVRPTEDDVDGLSMYMRSRRTPEDLASTKKNSGVFATTVEKLGAIGLAVHLDEDGPDRGPGHCLIPGIKYATRRTLEVQRLMDTLAHELYLNRLILPTRATE